MTKRNSEIMSFIEWLKDTPCFVMANNKWFRQGETLTDTELYDLFMAGDDTKGINT